MFQGGSMVAGVISGGLSQIQDTRSLTKGEINRGDYAVSTTRNVSSAVGVMAGIEYGALLGSAVLPGIGTIAGSIVGAVAGNSLGRYVGHHAGNLVFKNIITIGTQNGQNMPLQTPDAGQ